MTSHAGKIMAGATAAATLALGACSGASQASQATGPGMMGGGASNYHYSSLSCNAPAGLSGQRVDVRLADMGMTQMMGGTAALGEHMMLQSAPATVKTGPVTLVAVNVGWRTHELVIMPLTADAVAGQRTPGPDGKVAETGSLGEASASCGAGTGEGIRAGTVSWISVNLPPGRYELICNLANHYADGMHQEFSVTA